MPHFFATDLAGLALALLLGIPTILLPGYALGWWLHLLDFRSQPAATRWSFAAIFGVSMMPILLYLPFKLFSVWGMWTMLTILWIVSVPHICGCPIQALFRLEWGRYRDSLPRWREIPRAAKIAAFAWLILGTCLMLDLTVDHKLYPSSVIIDQSFRANIIASLSQGDHLPPVNNFYYLGEPLKLRYHYILFILGAAQVRMSGGLITAHIALASLSLWVGLAFIALVSLFVQRFEPFDDTHRATRIAWLLLAVGGLDLLPAGSYMLHQWVTGQRDIIPFPDVEWWNGWGQVFSWIDTAVWQPHHLAALSACLFGCLLLWDARDATKSRRWLPALAAGVAFACAAGMSIYVTAVFFVFLALVAIEVALNASRYLPPLITSGLVGLALLVPFILEIRSPATSGGRGTELPFGIGLRPFQPLSSMLLQYDVKNLWAWNLGFILALPLNYLIEFGVFFIAGIWCCLEWRKSPSKSDFRLHLTVGLAAVSLSLCTFMWSGTNSSNDFGYRGVLPAQFVLLLCATHLFARYWGRPLPQERSMRWLVRSAWFAAALGIVTNVFGAVLLRGSIGFADAGVALRNNTLRGGNVAERIYDMRAAYDWIRVNSSNEAVIQENPESSFAIMAGQYAQRKSAVYASHFTATFVADPGNRDYQKVFDRTLASTRNLFLSAADRQQAFDTCAANGIDYLIVQDCDPVWVNHKSYVWTATPVFASPHVRVFRCS